MNPFVDFQKRSIALPFGCKDLGAAPQFGDHQPDFKSSFKLIKGLTDAERYITSLLLAPGLTYLSLDELPRFQHLFQLGLARGALSIFLRIDGNDTGRLQFIRKFFKDAGLPPVVDCYGAIINSLDSRILIYPLPVDAPDASELVTQLLRMGFAVPEDAELYFSRNEKTIS